MELKEALKQYRDIKKEIRKLEEELKGLENIFKNVDVVDASSVKFPYIQKHLKIESVDTKKRNRLITLTDILKKRYDGLLEQQIALEEYIGNIPNSRLRQIFEYRYFYDYSWHKVAYLVGGNAESVKKEYQRYLEKS